MRNTMHGHEARERACPLMKRCHRSLSSPQSTAHRKTYESAREGARGVGASVAAAVAGREVALGNLGRPSTPHARHTGAQCGDGVEGGGGNETRTREARGKAARAEATWHDRAQGIGQCSPTLAALGRAPPAPS